MDNPLGVAVGNALDELVRAPGGDADALEDLLVSDHVVEICARRNGHVARPHRPPPPPVLDRH
ncbi:MAG: hypothetical protein JOZ07_17830 [Solirubrobacterales bacterium]|nr:hypothetical protein [Solirubrobacterales bacterium]